MSFVGTLDEMPLPDILQFLSLASRSGKLWLTCTDGQGLILFRRGRIIYAASSSVRETFGSILLCRGLVDEPTLLRALKLQHQAREEKRLGVILVEMGALTPDTMESVIRQQVERVILEFLSWDGGFFKFDPITIPERGEVEVEVEAKDFLLPEGVSGEHLALELARQSDELEVSNGGREDVELPAIQGHQADLEEAPEPSTSTLSSLMGGLTAPMLTGELAMELIRRAAGTVKRCVLFIRRGDEFIGVGGFGIRGGPFPADTAVRALAIPLSGESVIAMAAASGRSYVGTMDRSRWNDLLVAQLGGEAPYEVMAVPVLVRGRSVAVLYGDNAPERAPIGAIGTLELLATDVGVAMEKAARPGAGEVSPEF